jgi:hypothetical protein
MHMRTSLHVLAAVALAVVGAACFGGGSPPERLLQPEHLKYVGAFRLPEDSGGSSWQWGGDALTYHLGGDPKGPDDGHPGSLFGVGHDHQQFVSEISIPKPAASAAKRAEDLPAAATLQPFRDVRGGRFAEYEMYRCGLEYLPPAKGQGPGALFVCWGQHMQEGDLNPTHTRIGLDLAAAKPAGPWRIGEFQSYVLSDYQVAIPDAWASAHTPGMRLATGRYRDGGQGSQGPVLIAYAAPEGDPTPPAGAQLKARPLLLYSPVTEENGHVLKDYHHADEWSACEWLTAGPRAAVIFVGTKGLGKCWYGFANGVVWPDEPPFPPIPAPPNDSRGWWSTQFEGQILFYDPADLAAVAAGKMEPWQPQPYATIRIDSLLYNVKGPQQKYHVRAAAFDRDRGFLYVMEPWADGDKPIVHVWRVTP